MSDISSTPAHRRLERTPERVSSHTPWWHIAALVVGVAVFVMGANVATSAYLAEKTPNWAYFMTGKKWRQLDQADGTNNWLIFGDSAAVHGFDPEEFDRYMPGAKSHNFAIVATLGLTNDAWMLSEYIRLHGAPKNVVLIHTFDAWQRTYNAQLLSKIPRSFGYWSDFVPAIEMDNEKTWDAFVSRYFPVFAEAKSIKRVLDGSAWNHRWFSVYENGFSPARIYRKKTFNGDLRSARRTLKSKGSKKVGKLNRKALAHIAALAKTHKFDVFVVKAPIWKKLVRDKYYRWHQKKIWAHLRALMKGSKNIHLIDTEFPYPTKEMEAAVDHVAPRAAWDYTRRLAKLLKAKKKIVQGRSP